MSRTFDNQPNINKQKIFLNARPTPDNEVSSSQGIIYLDSSDEFLKIKRELGTEVIRTGVLNSISVTGNLNLNDDDSGKIFFLENNGGFTVTLPDIDEVEIGTNYKFYVTETLGAGNTYTISNNPVDTNNLQGGFYGSEITNVADYPTATNNDNLIFNQNADVGDWVEVLSDGADWQIHGFLKAQNSLTVT